MISLSVRSRHNGRLLLLLAGSCFSTQQLLAAIPENQYPAHCQQSLQNWAAYPAKADLMVLTTHPDDEGIFFGGALPYYTQVQNKSTILIGMTGDTNNHVNIDRKEELERAAWHYGVQHQPINYQYPDVNSNVANQWEPGDGFQGVVDRIATDIRRYQPDVVLTHDLNGEYGHAAHQLTASAVEAAYSVAADENVDLAGLPAWQTQKLYLHRYQNPGDNNPVPSQTVTANGYLYHSWETTHPELGGKSSREIANEALQCHVDAINVWPDLQVSSRAVTGEVFDGHHAEDWGLRFSEVGPDTVDSDFFQNVGNPPVDPPAEPMLQPIPLVNAGFSADGWTNEEQFIQNSGSNNPSNVTGWAADGLVRAYNLNLDGDGDPTTDSGPQVRTWDGWVDGDELIQIGFQNFTDPENALSQDAGAFEQGKEYQFSIDLAPGFENAVHNGFVQILRASDGTMLAETTFAGNWTGSSSTTTQSVSYTATAADDGSAIRVRFGADAGGSGTSVFANPVLGLVIPALPEDLDGDGDVDDADFGIAFAAFTGPNNGPSSNPDADLDGDGDVDDADFGIAFAAFTGPGAAANVPEPTSLLLLGTGGLLIARRRRV